MSFGSQKPLLGVHARAAFAKHGATFAATCGIWPDGSLEFRHERRWRVLAGGAVLPPGRSDNSGAHP
jgi:hypothetical protein